MGNGCATGKAVLCGMLFLVWGELAGWPLMGFFLYMIPFLSRNVVFDLCFYFVPHNHEGRGCAKFVSLDLLLIRILHSGLRTLK